MKTVSSAILLAIATLSLLINVTTAAGNEGENCVIVSVNLLGLTITIPLPLSVCKYDSHDCSLLHNWDPRTIVVGTCNGDGLRCCLLEPQAPTAPTAHKVCPEGYLPDENGRCREVQL